MDSVCRKRCMMFVQYDEQDHLNENEGGTTFKRYRSDSNASTGSSCGGNNFTANANPICTGREVQEDANMLLCNEKNHFQPRRVCLQCVNGQPGHRSHTQFALV
eukprot:Nk52_evm3s270 gene=Nk52_evmTU3s270